MELNNTSELVSRNDVSELMHRRNNGVEVFLLWHKEANILSIVLNDEGAKPPFYSEFVVPNDKGIQAFEHPYAWLPEDQTVKIPR